MRRRLLLALALLVLALVLGLLGLGSGPLLRAVTGLPLQGSLWTGLSLVQAQGEQAPWRWRVEGLRLEAPQRREGRWLFRLQLDSLTLQQQGVSSAPPPTLAALQADLQRLARLPDWTLDAAVTQLVVNGQRSDGLRLQLDSGSGGLQLHEAKARWQGAALQLRGRLDPEATLEADASAARDALRLQLQAQGRLDALRLQAHIDDRSARLLDLDAGVDALATQPLKALQARWQALDPQQLHEAAPAGRWQGRASLQPAEAGRLQIDLDTTNEAARRLDEGGWPLRRLRLHAAVDPAQWQALELQTLALELGSAGQAAGRVELAAPQALPRAGAPWQTELRLVGLVPRALRANWPAWPIDGQLALNRAAEAEAALDWQLQLSSRAQPWRLAGRGDVQGQRLRVSEAQLSSDSLGQLRLQGEAERLPTGWRSRGEATARQLRATLPPWTAPSLLSGPLRWQWQQTGARHEGEVVVQLQDGSQFAGLPLTGEARWAPGPSGAPWSVDLQGPELSLQADGDPREPLVDLKALARPAHWHPQQLRWQAGDLARLQPLWQPWLAQLAGRSHGSWLAEGRQLQAEAEGLRVQWPKQPLVRVQRAELRWQGDDGSLRVQDAQRERLRVHEASGRFGLSQPLQWQAEGSWQDAHGDAQAWRSQGRSGSPVQDADGVRRWPALQASLGPAQGTPWLQIASSELRWHEGEGRLAPGTLTLAGEPLALQQAQARPGRWQLQLEGRPRLRSGLALLDPAGDWQGDASVQLRLHAWQDEEAAQPALDLQVDGLRGSLQWEGRALDLQALLLRLRQQADGSAGVQAQWRGGLIGELDADLQQGAGAAGALAGRLRARLPRLQTLRPWLPPGLVLDGEASVDAEVAGTRSSPLLRGSLSSRVERLQHTPSGFAAQQGRLAAQFDAQQLRITELSLQGSGDDGGRLSGEGRFEWREGHPVARLQVQAEKLRALARFDRRLVLSGTSRLQLDGRQLKLQGQVRVDEGFFQIGRPDAPALDEDVKVAGDAAREAAPPAASRWQREVDLQLDLGERLRIQGRGFASRLTGQLHLLETGGKPWQLVGSIQTQGGRYKAYGQTLDIESGELRFAGPPANPRLALLAIKPDIEHRVGVSVTGSLEQPRVRLFAEPELPDNDKLAWLLLGRDPRELPARDTALLQRAALAVLAGEGESTVGQIMDRLGLTEFSVSQGEDAGTVLRLGAQLSRRWSLGYERSLNATSGSWQLVYRLGQRFRVRAQSGADSAVDLLWLWRYD